MHVDVCFEGNWIKSGSEITNGEEKREKKAEGDDMRKKKHTHKEGRRKCEVYEKNMIRY